MSGWHMFAALLTAAALIDGGVSDFRTREIPDRVPVALMAAGVLAGPDRPALWGLVLPAALLPAACRFLKTDLPGGDYKLLCTLGFAVGPRKLAFLLWLAGVLSMVYGRVKKLPGKRRIPLCTYIASAYLMGEAVNSCLQAAASLHR